MHALERDGGRFVPAQVRNCGVGAICWWHSRHYLWWRRNSFVLVHLDGIDTTPSPPLLDGVGTFAVCECSVSLMHELPQYMKAFGYLNC